jgi:hypothetical protein
MDGVKRKGGERKVLNRSRSELGSGVKKRSPD